MESSSTFITYPVFRLTVSLATGIFLSERLFSGGLSVACLFAAFLAFSLLAFGFYFLRPYRFRFLFGCTVCACFMCLGMLWATLRVGQVYYDWDEEEAVYTGVVEDIPQPKKKTTQATVRIQACLDTLSAQWKPVDRAVLLYWMPDSLQRPPQMGDRICFHACVKRPESASLLTGFDYGRYLEVQGISGTAVAFRGKWQVLSHSSGLSFRQKALLLREAVVESYRRWGLEDEVLAVVSALTVGDKSELTPELKATYSAAGVSHILALSGLHIGILAMILTGLLYPFRYIRGGRTGITMVIVCLLWGFALMTGLSPSVVRAVTMYTLYIIASFVVEDRLSGFHALSLAAFLMLLYQPLYLFDVSFQLSFVAVLSILLFYPVFSTRKIRVRPVRYLWNTMAVSLAAQLGTLPLILYYFGAFPTYFLLANLVVTPLAVCILGSALSALCLNMLWGVGDWMVSGLETAVVCLNRTMEEVQGWSGSQFTSIYFSEIQVALGFLLLIALYGCMQKYSFRRLAFFLLVLNLTGATFVYERLHPDRQYVCFARSSVYTKNQKELTLLDTPSGLYTVGMWRIGLIDDIRWRNKQTDRQALLLDYAYICRGFRGSIAELTAVFSPRQVLLDSSLNPHYKEVLEAECREKGIAYADVPECGMLLALHP